MFAKSVSRPPVPNVVTRTRTQPGVLNLEFVSSFCTLLSGSRSARRRCGPCPRSLRARPAIRYGAAWAERDSQPVPMNTRSRGRHPVTGAGAHWKNPRDTLLHVDTDRKIALLEERLTEANHGRPPDFQLWRQQTEVVLRTIIGDASPLYLAFREVKYTPLAWGADSEASFARAQMTGVNEAIAILKAAKTEVELTGGVPNSDHSSASGRQIFIVHGHDDSRKHEVARVLSALTKNEPVILHEQANNGRGILEKFEAFAADAGYAVVIATADDFGRVKDSAEESARARQNVILELGFFYGALGRSKTALLYENGVEIPSDIAGLAYIPLDSGSWKLKLAQELDGAGIGIDWAALR